MRNDVFMKPVAIKMCDFNYDPNLQNIAEKIIGKRNVNRYLD